MSNDFWRGWWQGQFWSDILRSPNTTDVAPAASQRSGLGCLVMLGILPIGLECALLGGGVFSYVSHPPFGWTPDFPGLGWPDFVGWVAAIFCCLIYLTAHALWPLGLLLTAFWTVAWAALFHNLDVRGFNAAEFLITFATQGWGAAEPMVRGHDWKYGIAFGAMALIGHLTLVLGPHLGVEKGQAKANFMVDLVQTLVLAAVVSAGIAGVFWLVFTLGSLIH